jgi:hypothetical protein
MKPLVPVTCIVAASAAVWLVQWSKLHHRREEMARPDIPAEAPSTPAPDAARHSKDKIDGLDDRAGEVVKQRDPAALERFLVDLGEDPRSGDKPWRILFDYAEVDRAGAVAVALNLPVTIPEMDHWNYVDHLCYMWSFDHPAAALDWLRSDGGRVPPETRERMFHTGCARLLAEDPRQALAHAIAGGLEDNGKMGQEMGKSLVDPQAVRNSFRAMDDMAAASSDTAAIAEIRRGIVGSLGSLFQYQSFAAASGVIDECLTADEKIHLANRCNELRAVTDAPKWADWLTGIDVSHLDPDGAIPHPLFTRMQSWASEDPNAAGSWLRGMPEGHLKEDAIATYAEVVRRFEPEEAAVWALQLPQDKWRAQLLERIAGDLEKRDPVAAEKLRRDKANQQ